MRSAAGLAQKQKSRVPAHIEYNDLLSAGMMGLMEALGKFRPEQIFCPLNAQALNFVDVLAAAIVAFSRQSLRVFVGKDRTHGRNHRRRSKILRSNQFQTVLLAAQFLSHEPGKLRVILLYKSDGVDGFAVHKTIPLSQNNIKRAARVGLLFANNASASLSICLRDSVHDLAPSAHN